MQTAIRRSGWVWRIASTLLQYHHQANLMNGVAYVVCAYPSRLYARLLHDRSMRTQSLTAFVFHLSGVN